MNEIKKSNYRLQTDNKHLKNILEEDYYIELGTVDLIVLESLLAGQVLELTSCIYPDIATTGVGQISSDLEYELDYQLTYLLQLRQKSSSYKIFLTCGVIKYVNRDGLELFAPVVLIPVDIDYKQGKIVCSGEPILNTILVNELEVIHGITLPKPEKISTLFQMDNYGLKLANEVGCSFEIGNFLTYGKVQYPDFSFKDDFFSVERSLYETTAEAIIDEYFKNIRGVLPTNINQKYVLLKAHAGENFAVDGRLGSGKTYTILNIVADALLNNKRVLYVNQDIDNIIEFERNLRLLEMGPLTYNFAKVERLLSEPEIIMPKASDEEYSLEVIQPIIDYENSIFTKIHGFLYKSILSNLATIKNTIPNIEPIELEVDLERFEAETIYKKLKEIEVILTKIDPLSMNMWTKVVNYISTDNTSELIKAVKEFKKANVKFVTKLKAFCKKYYIKMPTTYVDAHRLITNIKAFVQTPPPECWINSFKFDEARQSAINLHIYEGNKKELDEDYQKLVNENYSYGDAEELLDILEYKHLSQLEYDDKVLALNELLSDKLDIKKLSQDIENHLDSIEKITIELIDKFDIKKFPDNMYHLLNKLEELLGKYKVKSNWIEHNLSSHLNFLNIFKPLYEDIVKAKDLQSYILKYMIKAEILDYDLLKEASNNRNFQSMIEHNLNKKLLKHDNLLASDLYRDVLEYMTYGTKILKDAANLRLDTKMKYEEFLNNFKKYYEFVESLTNQEAKFIFGFFQKVKIEKVLAENSFIKLIKTFNYECDYIDNLVNKLKQYGIYVDGIGALEYALHLQEWVSYLTRVNDVKTRFKQIFVNKNITYQNIIKLVTMDRHLYNLTELIEERSTEYISLLGDAYRGLDTDCVSLKTLIEQYDDFKEKVINQSAINKILKRDVMLELTKEYPELNDLSTKWDLAHIDFSRFFSGGQPYFLECNILEVDELITLFVDRIDQIDNTLTALTYANDFGNFGLKDLKEGIISSDYELNISERFMYTLLTKYREEFLINHPEYNPTINILDYVEKFNLVERNYCTKNIDAIYQKIEQSEKKYRVKYGKNRFNSYNNIIQHYDKYRQIYLATADIFNSDLDLNLFDLVLVDDCHLTGANKYHKMSECKQVIAFGDSSFRSSIANSLLKKINSSSIIKFNRRYVMMSSRFKNHWSINDQYIYDYNHKIDSICLESVRSLVDHVTNYFYEKPNSLINVIVGSNEMKRTLYTLFVQKLSASYDGKQIVTLLNHHIRLINCTNENTRYATDVFFYYDDMKDIESLTGGKVFRNYMAVSGQVTFIYHPGKNVEETDRIKDDIKNIIGKSEVNQKETSGVVKVLYDRLKEKGLKVETGFGRFDIIVRGKGNINNMSIIIEGNDSTMPFSLLDDYQYYYGEYKRVGWNVLIYNVEDLLEDLSGCVVEIVDKFYASKTSPVEQLSFDEILLDTSDDGFAYSKTKGRKKHV